MAEWPCYALAITKLDDLQDPFLFLHLKAVEHGTSILQYLISQSYGWSVRVCVCVSLNMRLNYNHLKKESH